MKGIQKNVKYTSFSTADADHSQKTAEGKYTAHGPTEGLKNDPFLGKKSLKKRIFLNFPGYGTWLKRSGVKFCVRKSLVEKNP